MGGKRDLLPQYERVVRIVNALCNAQTSHRNVMDAVASKCLFNLWRLGGFEWDMAHIRNFVLREIRRAKWGARRSATQCVTDLTEEDPIAYFEALGASRWGNQETVVAAWMASRLLEILEPRERLAILILADGGNPLDVANEMETDPVGAMLLIRRARRRMRDHLEQVEERLVA